MSQLLISFGGLITFHVHHRQNSSKKEGRKKLRKKGRKKNE
jgi:hypothetical protein